MCLALSRYFSSNSTVSSCPDSEPKLVKACDVVSWAFGAIMGGHRRELSRCYLSALVDKTVRLGVTCWGCLEHRCWWRRWCEKVLDGRSERIEEPWWHSVRCWRMSSGYEGQWQEGRSLGRGGRGVKVTVSQAAVLVPMSNLIKYPALKIKVGFWNLKSFRKKAETRFKADTLRTVWFVGLNRITCVYT